MTEFWYRYRDDLWKKVTVYNEEKSIHLLGQEDVNDEKLSCNIRRAQRAIEGYALCNVWQWFITCTLDPKKYDRKNLAVFHADLTRFFAVLRRRYPGIKFLLVPELHKKRDGWHMHGLLSGLPVDALRCFTLKEKIPKYIRDKIKSGDAVYDFPAYRNKFGFVDVEPVRCRDAAARYVTKYITKDSQQVTARNMALHDHLYYVSRGLAKPERVELPQVSYPAALSSDKKKAPGRYPDAFPDWLVEGNSFSFEYGDVQWYESPFSQS